jgi:cytochrome c551/c552
MMPFVLSQCAKKPEVDHRSRTEPTADRVSFEEGAALYGKQCASCHGPEGQGAIGPRLNDASCKSCGDQGKLIDVIARTMPPANPTSCDKTCATLVAQYIRAELYLKSTASCEDSSIVPGKRAVRLLTNREYDNTVRTLFQLPEGMSPASSFRKRIINPFFYPQI